MKVFVCIKQVPDTETKIKLLPDQSGIDPAGIKWVMNPYDELAVEEAIKFKEKNPTAQVWAITYGPKARSIECLRTAMAMGVDESIVIDGPDSLDAYSTAKALAFAIKQEGPAHLVFSGKLSIDKNQSSVPQMVAEFLNIPHTSVISKFEATTESILVERDSDGGSKEVVQMVLPALVSANKGLNMPRFVSLPGIMKAKKKTIKEFDLAAVGVVATDSKVKYTHFQMPAEKPAVKMIAGSVDSQVNQLINSLRDEAKVL